MGSVWHNGDERDAFPQRIAAQGDEQHDPAPSVYRTGHPACPPDRERPLASERLLPPHRARTVVAEGLEVESAVNVA
jgi:hypothetical protein